MSNYNNTHKFRSVLFYFSNVILFFQGIGLCSGSNATPLSVLITASSTAPINSFTSALTTLNSSLQPSVGQCTTTSAGISSPAACSPIGIAYDRSRGSGGNGIDGPSAAILQFHQQCQQQQNAFQPQTRSLSLSSTSVALSNSSPTAVPSNHLERSRQKYLEQVQSQQQQQHPAPLIAKFSGGKQYVPKNFSQQQLFTPQQQQQPPQSLEYANDSLSSAENDPSQFTSQQQLATSNAPSSSKVHSLDSEASAVLPSHFKVSFCGVQLLNTINILEFTRRWICYAVSVQWKRTMVNFT